MTPEGWMYTSGAKQIANLRMKRVRLSLIARPTSRPRHHWCFAYRWRRQHPCPTRPAQLNATGMSKLASKNSSVAIACDSSAMCFGETTESWVSRASFYHCYASSSHLPISSENAGNVMNSLTCVLFAFHASHAIVQHTESCQ